MPHRSRTQALTLIALAVGLLIGVSSAQTYQWRDVVQVVELRPDGDVFVSDTRTLWTDEDFGEAFICLDLTPPRLSPDLDISVTLLDSSAALGSGPSWRVYRQPCQVGGRNDGVELVVRNDRRIQERRVRFDYVLHGSVKAYSDVVEWYWNLVELDHPVIFGYHLTVRLPGPVDFPFDGYVHTRGNLERPVVAFNEQRTALEVTFERIPRGNGVEVRLMMDPQHFELTGSQPGHEMLLRDEAREAGIDDRASALTRLRNSPLWGLLSLLIVGGYGAGVARAYRRGGREPTGDGMLYPFEPPSDLPPAAVTALQLQRFSPTSMGPAMHATIMDLARRGYAEFRPQGRKMEIKLDLAKSADGLLPFEVAVLNYLKAAAQQNRRGDHSLLEFGELKRYSQSRASSFMPPWATSVRAWLERQLGGKLIVAESEKAAGRWALRGLGGIVACSLAAAALAGPARAAFIAGAVICAVIAIFAGAGLPRWRDDVAAEVYGWRGFKRTLTDYTKMKDAPPDFFRLWDRYFVYAAALGVAERYLREIRRAAPLAGVDEAQMVRTGHWMGGSTASFASLGSLASSVSSLSSALSAASASASSGGSSSGGGGGGGGGGSSGGR